MKMNRDIYERLSYAIYKGINEALIDFDDEPEEINEPILRKETNTKMAVQSASFANAHIFAEDTDIYEALGRNLLVSGEYLKEWLKLEVFETPENKKYHMIQGSFNSEEISYALMKSKWISVTKDLNWYEKLGFREDSYKNIKFVYVSPDKGICAIFTNDNILTVKLTLEVSYPMCCTDFHYKEDIENEINEIRDILKKGIGSSIIASAPIVGIEENGTPYLYTIQKTNISVKKTTLMTKIASKFERISLDEETANTYGIPIQNDIWIYTHKKNGKQIIVYSDVDDNGINIIKIKLVK